MNDSKNQTETFELPLNSHQPSIQINIPTDTNKTILPSKTDSFKSTRIDGKNNLLYTGKNTETKNFAISIRGDNNKIFIGSNCNLSGNVSIGGNDISVYIGNSTTFNKVQIFAKGSNHSVYIGKDCMFSSDIEIRTSDSHSVIDLDTNQKINQPDGVYIGDHVWVSKKVFIQKGSYIASDNIIGYGSLVNKEFRDSNTTIVGTPAKANKSRRVAWSRKGNVNLTDNSLHDWKKIPEF